MDISSLSSRLEDEQNLVSHLQKKIKELQVLISLTFNYVLLGYITHLVHFNDDSLTIFTLSHSCLTLTREQISAAIFLLVTSLFTYMVAMAKVAANINALHQIYHRSYCDKWI